MTWLRKAQRSSGGYALGGSGVVNSQSTAWAVQGLAAAGGGGKAVDRALGYLGRLRAADGHYRYSPSSDQTPIWVTAQVLLAVERAPFPLATVHRTSKPSGSKDQGGSSDGAGGGGSSAEPDSSVAPASPGGGSTPSPSTPSGGGSGGDTGGGGAPGGPDSAGVERLGSRGQRGCGRDAGAARRGARDHGGRRERAPTPWPFRSPIRRIPTRGPTRPRTCSWAPEPWRSRPWRGSSGTGAARRRSAARGSLAS